MPKLIDQGMLVLNKLKTGNVVGLVTGTYYSFGALEIDQVRVVAHPKNSGTVYFTSNTGTPGQGYPLTTQKNGSESVLILGLANLNLMWGYVEVAGDSISYMAESGLGIYPESQNQ